MAKKHLNKIFLSASIPFLDRDPKFYKTADVIAIRDSVRALTTILTPKIHLIFGGHPAITPLIKQVMERMDYDLSEQVTIYQSDFFKKYFSEDNKYFNDVKIIKEVAKDREKSILKKREVMLGENDFVAGIFIGGMEGIRTEYDMFKKLNPKALTFPIASTGAAAKIVYEEEGIKNDRLLNDYAYMSLFRDLLSDYL